MEKNKIVCWGEEYDEDVVKEGSLGRDEKMKELIDVMRDYVAKVNEGGDPLNNVHNLVFCMICSRLDREMLVGLVKKMSAIIVRNECELV